MKNPPAEVTVEQRVDVANGKYTFILRDDGTSHALRNGETWASIQGKSLANLVLALARDLIDARHRTEA